MKTFMVRIGDAMYDGTLKSEVNDTHVVLRHSNVDSQWTPKVKGETAVELHDDGNGATVVFKDGKSIQLDYSQVVELRALLNVHEDAELLRGRSLTKFTKRYLGKLKMFKR
jgi:hypothetical protein